MDGAGERAARKGRAPGRTGYFRRTWALLVEYDGGPYKGWQPNPLLATVCGVLGAAMNRAGIGATPFGASRTDAGVHARAQVASFTSHAEIAPSAFLQALNDELPTTIRARALREAHSAFHAHWSSSGKIYRYRISHCGAVHCWRLPGTPEVDLARLQQALRRLQDADDLSALCVGREDDPALRKLDRAQILEASPRGLTLEVEAAGFGKYLVRHLVSAAVGYAVGAFDDAALDGQISGAAPRPPRAAAEGLTLHRVLYPAEIDPFPDVDALCPDRVGT